MSINYGLLNALDSALQYLLPIIFLFVAFIVFINFLLLNNSKKKINKNIEIIQTYNQKNVKFDLSETLKETLKDVLEVGNLSYSKKLLQNIDLLKKLLLKSIENNLLSLITITFLWELFDFSFEKEFTELSSKKIANYVQKFDLEDYNFVEIISSNVPNLNVGKYLYSFDKDSNLKIIAFPLIEFNIKKKNRNTIMPYYKHEQESSFPILIAKTNVQNLSVQGTQVNEVNVITNVDKGKPSDAIFSEFMFGTSYAILKNMPKYNISSKNNVNDLRIVLLILKDKTSIEFKGFSIYKDLARSFSILDELNNTKPIIENEKSSHSNRTSQNYVQELKELKELLDQKIITQEEFDEKKKKILAK